MQEKGAEVTSMCGIASGRAVELVSVVCVSVHKEFEDDKIKTGEPFMFVYICGSLPHLFSTDSARSQLIPVLFTRCSIRLSPVNPAMRNSHLE